MNEFDFYSRRWTTIMWIHSTVQLLTVPCDVLFHDSGRQRCVTILQLISAYLVLVALTTVSRRLSSGHLDAGPGGQSWGGAGGGVWIASGGELQTQICRVSCAVRSHLGAVHLTECKMMRRRWMSWRWDSRARGRGYWGVIPDDKCPVWIIVMDGE